MYIIPNININLTRQTKTFVDTNKEGDWEKAFEYIKNSMHDTDVNSWISRFTALIEEDD